MRLKPTIFILFVIQFVILPVIALDENQTSIINQLAAATNMSNETLLNLFSSLNSDTIIMHNYTANDTCNYTYFHSFFVNKTELIDNYYTANDTRNMINSFEGTVDDRFMRIPEYYIKTESFNDTISSIREQLKNDTLILNDNMLNLAKNTDNRFNIAIFMNVVCIIGLAYILYKHKKEVIDVSDNIKSRLPEVLYEKKSIDELDSSKGFLERIKGISILKSKIGSMKLAEHTKNTLMDKVNQGIISDDNDIKNEIGALKAEGKHDSDRDKNRNRNPKKNR